MKAVADAQVEVARAKLEVDGVLGELRPSTKVEVDEVVAKLGNKPTQEAVDKEVAGRDVGKLIGEIGEAVSKLELSRQHRPEDGFEVVSNLEIVEPVPGYKSVSEYASRNPDVSPKELAKLREGGGKLYRSITEIDTAVFKSIERLSRDGRL